jgi:hypothetical protein
MPLVAFQSRAMESTMRIVGQLRFRRDFQPEGAFAGVGFALIAVRIKQASS